MTKLGNYEAGIVSRATHDGVGGIAERALEEVFGVTNIHLHVPASGFDNSFVFDHGLQHAGNAAPLNCERRRTQQCIKVLHLRRCHASEIVDPDTRINQGYL